MTPIPGCERFPAQLRIGPVRPQDLFHPFPKRPANRQNSYSRIHFSLTLLCVALIVLCGIVQASHSHNQRAGHGSTEASCSLCITAHAGIQLAATPTLISNVTASELLEPPTVESAAVTPDTLALYIRPPPVFLTLA
ncbi:MAG TPA: hypothetical protein VGN16_11830 [Acidobacteriaceae bacterium]|jgi:hypothetical protein